MTKPVPEQWAALDLIAERIRALGFQPPRTYGQFSKIASIAEAQSVPKAMVEYLVAAQEPAACGLFLIVEDARDQSTADFLSKHGQETVVDQLLRDVALA